MSGAGGAARRAHGRARRSPPRRPRAAGPGCGPRGGRTIRRTGRELAGRARRGAMAAASSRAQGSSWPGSRSPGCSPSASTRRRWESLDRVLVASVALLAMAVVRVRRAAAGGRARAPRDARVGPSAFLEIAGEDPRRARARRAGGAPCRIRPRPSTTSGSRTRDEASWALRDVDLRLAPGRTLALVGPSGSGQEHGRGPAGPLPRSGSGRGDARRRGPACRSARRTSDRGSRLTARTRTCSPRRSWRTSGWRGRAPTTRPSRPPCAARGSGTGSRPSPTGGTRSSGRTARPSPAASDAGSRSRGRSWRTRRSSCSTSRPRTSIRPPRPRSSRTRSRRPTIVRCSSSPIGPRGSSWSIGW